MTNEKLAQELNNAVGLAGKQAVTVNVIRQWVGWGFLPRASVKGHAVGQWSRDASALAKAHHLAKLRLYGLVRKDQLVCRTYIDGWPIEAARLRPAARKRARSLIAKMLRELTSTFNRDAGAPLSRAKKRAVLKQMGALDPRFKGTPFELNKADLIAGFRSTLTGDAASFGIIEDSDSVFSKSLSEISRENSLINEFIYKSTSGLLGDTSEIESTLISSIEECDDSDLRYSSILTRSFLSFSKFNLSYPHIVEQIPIAKEGVAALITFIPIIERSEWPTAIFLSTLNGLHRFGAGKADLIEEIECLNHQLTTLSEANLL